MSPSPRSEGLQLETRDAVDEMRVGGDGRLHFKHRIDGYAAIDAVDLVHGRLLLRSKNGTERVFSDVDALLAAGWAVD